MRWVRTAIGAVIAISVIPIIAETVAELTGAEGALAGTVAATLLDLAPLIFVAGVLAYLFTATSDGRRRN